ncbi:MAG TPA: lipopolysaccharide transport periplasmic protein LptA [Campylobacterales bacterium]|nr:lipopolysaccharide transport periplasmic protein LptA [Campylobacterales bacterium]HIP59247.1 lipopolysaccharide transport periplasmic protein LptA [Campylobacterales bacterium]
MKKLLLLIAFSFTLVASEQVEVNAEEFKADEKKLISYFRGSVFIKKGKDEIKADLLKIIFDKTNKPIKYDATGNVSFKISTSSQHFVGTANQIIYEPSNKKYKAFGHVNIKETIKNQTLKGESITIDRISGKTSIIGSKNRPVKFIFTVEE